MLGRNLRDLPGYAPSPNPPTFASQEQGVPQKTQEQLDKEEAREAYKRELRETSWAAYHLNFPQNARGFGPWANEQISFSEARRGSLLGYGFFDNPLNQTEAEQRAERAKTANRIRTQARDAFNSGQTYDQIAHALSQNTLDLVPEDLRKHYQI